MASTAAKLLEVAAGQVGYLEGRDPDGNWNNINKFGAWYAAQVGSSAYNGVAWCDIFVSWCAWMSGNGDLIPKSAYVPGRLAWARSKNLTGHYPPEPGDLGIVMDTVYAGNGKTSTSAVHIFIVEKYLGGGRVQTLEGNTNNDGSPQGNGVYRLVRNDSPDSSRYIYIRPPYLAAALPPLGTGGASAPAPKPAPAPAPKPAPAPSRPTLHLENLRPGRSNADVRTYNKLLWAKQGPVYKARNLLAWMRESSSVYGRMTEQVTADTYAHLNRVDPKTWGAPPSRPCWPGPQLIRWLGGNPV